MQPVEARVGEDILDAIQVACGRVPLRDFRLKKDCAICLYLADKPATTEWNERVRTHVLDEHADEIVLPFQERVLTSMG